MTKIVSDAKGRILERIRKALEQKCPPPIRTLSFDESVFVEEDEAAEVLFAENLLKTGAKFVYCESAVAAVDSLKLLAEQKNWRHLYCWDEDLQNLFQAFDFRKCRIGRNLEKADAGITTCEWLVARTGSVWLSSAQSSGRTLSAFPPVHIVFARQTQLLRDHDEAIERLQKRYGKQLPSYFCINTGPSRTADIEKTLVKGMHGPKDLYVFFLEKK